jgi:hypothetical protein
MTTRAPAVRHAIDTDAAVISATMRRRVPELNYGSDEMVATWVEANYSEAAVLARIASTTYLTAVAETDGAFEGSAYLSRADGYIGGFAVAVDGRGAGRAMLRRLVAAGSHRTLTMSVVATNERMLGMAGASGFVSAGRDPDTSWFMDTEFLLLKRLAGALSSA